MADNVLLRKRLTIETLFDKLKPGMGLEHTRRRSPINALVHVLSCLAATTLAQTKIKIGTLIITDPIPGNHTATLATPGRPTLHLGVGVVSGYPPPRLTLPTPPVGREPVPAKGGTARRSASSSSNGFDSFCRPPSAARPAAGAAVPAAALGAGNGSWRAGCDVFHSHRQLHVKVPLVPLLALLHLQITFSSAVLPPCWRRKDAAIHNRSSLEHQTLLCPLLLGAGKQHLAQSMTLQQMAEVEDRLSSGAFSSRIPLKQRTLST
ncbi:MAG: hypothetical protein F4Z73_01360 [Synechococcus sp. SB0668_bin_13]|nr:hypothetical protein [Synechococcus sp. SB0668_bin_13]